MIKRGEITPGIPGRPSPCRPSTFIPHSIYPQNPSLQVDLFHGGLGEQDLIEAVRCGKAKLSDLREYQAGRSPKPKKTKKQETV